MLSVPPPCSIFASGFCIKVFKTPEKSKIVAEIIDQVHTCLASETLFSSPPEDMYIKPATINVKTERGKIILNPQLQNKLTNSQKLSASPKAVSFAKTEFGRLTNGRIIK